LIRVIRHSYLLFAVLMLLCTQEARPQAYGPENFHLLIADIVKRTVTGRQESISPTASDLREWRKAFSAFHARSYDNCRKILARYNYVLLQVSDGRGGIAYDVIRENTPVTRGWGTFIFNRNESKRLYVQVPHPLRDAESAPIGGEMFRKLGAEWLLISGTDRSGEFADDEIPKLNETLFQQWHEMLTDLIHVTLSVHTFPSQGYPHPIDTTDVVVSNGRTTDEQWGISQISLALRDTLRRARLSCALAMYDSGYARLSGTGSKQGTFSNDSVGFGHWLNLEFSDRIHNDQFAYSNLLAAVDKALDVTGQKVSRQMNRAFGLVSPRVVKVDSQHRLLFPPPASENYRIISFNSREVKHDTVVIRVGDWMNLNDPSVASASISSIDPRQADFIRKFGSRSSRESGGEIAKIVERPQSGVSLGNRGGGASSSSGSDNAAADEPLQVHRIPFEPILASTVTAGNFSGAPEFHWQGTVSSGFSPSTRVFQFAGGVPQSNGFNSRSNLLIPIVNSSYPADGAKFVGVQMTAMLVNQITRLAEAAHAQDDVTLLAEQDEHGKYFLRIFPGRSPQHEPVIVKQ
jgi:hypothetical protein